MERIVGEPISSAQWASEVFTDGDAWERASTVIKECLVVDEFLLHEDATQITWIADSLTVCAEYRAMSPLPQVRITIQVFSGFDSDDDGLFLASNLNHTAVGGAFIYRPLSRSLDFVLYCAVAIWSDFALLLLAAETAIGHCENLSRREDTLRFANCRSAAKPHPVRGKRTSHHPSYEQQFWDIAEFDFISGIWLSDRERKGLFERVTDECPWVDLQPRWPEQIAARTIETMDFGYQVEVDHRYSSVLNNYNAFALTEFNSWTDFGRSIVVTSSLPLFTWKGIFDDGASHTEAVRLANLLNQAANEMCWQKLGLGAWFAKGSQICFSMAIPHANLKPVVMGSPRFDVADVVFDVVNPNMVHRYVNVAVRDLHQINVQSCRDPQDMDSIKSVARLRHRPAPIRARYETIQTGKTHGSLWELPSIPLLVYGVFNPVGPSLGSIEIVHASSSQLVVNRYRHHTGSSERVLAEITAETEDFLATIEAVVGQLHALTSIPDFLNIPVDLDHDVQGAVTEGLFFACSGFTNEGVDLDLKARSIRHQPNPWWRPMDADTEPTPEVPEFAGLQSAEAYLATAMNPDIVDYNLGLFQAWWEGARAFLRDPNAPDEATRIVEWFTEHTLDRMRGPQLK